MENSQEFPKTVELYEAPAIEVTDIETEQNILGGSGTPPDFDGGDW
ncbi:MAG TPA: hypothetical protein PL097_06485 [Dysgonamonadaceae bacterium]|jgi:hypothetical protein|nr:hypothetical protein [Seramator thermalis]HOM63457.1 hypothetical protein [Dysgonamonadaceae bacterium]